LSISSIDVDETFKELFPAEKHSEKPYFKQPPFTSDVDAVQSPSDRAQVADDASEASRKDESSVVLDGEEQVEGAGPAELDPSKK